MRRGTGHSGMFRRALIARSLVCALSPSARSTTRSTTTLTSAAWLRLDDRKAARRVRS